MCLQWDSNRLMGERITVVQPGRKESSICCRLHPAVICPLASSSIQSYWDTGVLQPLPYLDSLPLKANRNVLGETFFTTQEYPSKGVTLKGTTFPAALHCCFGFSVPSAENYICCYSHHLVGTVLTGPLRGLELPWLGIRCRITFTVSCPTSGLWLCQVIYCLGSIFSSRQEAADSLLCDGWLSLKWVLSSSAVL